MPKEQGIREIITGKSAKHPCFNRAASGSCGRVHLPVAPRCNVQCNYCNRKYDCVNESRPGVTSAVLAPEQALAYLRGVLAREPRITVVGIAGPGDPMANPEETMATLRLAHAEFPDLLFCLSTNGLGLPGHVDELAECGLSHATVTVNTVDPDIGAQVYAWTREGDIVHRGRSAAEFILDRQLESIAELKARGLEVKINTILIPGVNTKDGCAPIRDVAETVRKLGADIMNVMPLRPTAGTPFADLTEPTHTEVAAVRSGLGRILPQMTHCRRCRADAVGLLHADRSGELCGLLTACAKLPARGGREGLPPSPPAGRGTAPTASAADA